MANIKSAKKRVKTNEIRRQRNSQRRSRVKTLFKKLDLAETKEELDRNLSIFFSEVDRVSRQVFHRNKVSRLKSQAAKKIADKLATLS